MTGVSAGRAKLKRRLPETLQGDGTHERQVLLLQCIVRAVRGWGLPLSDKS